MWQFVIGFIGFIVVIAVLGAVIYVAPKGWRTIVVNAVAGIIPVATVFFDALANVDLTKFLDKPMALGLGLGVIVVNLFLRAITTTAVGVK